MKQENRYNAIKSFVEKGGNKHRVALKLGITERQVNRLIKTYREKGKAGFIHGNTGKAPVFKVCESTRDQIHSLYISKYEGANFQHFTEKLKEKENINLSVVTITSILESYGVFSPKVTKKRKKRILKELEAKKNAAKCSGQAKL